MSTQKQLTLVELYQIREAYRHFKSTSQFVRAVDELIAVRETGPQERTAAAMDVLAERQRQQLSKGYSIEQDDTYTCCELSAAALCYIEPMEAENHYPADWHDDSFKPSDYRRNLVKAGALILAEIERLDRAAAAIAEEK